MLRIGCAVGGKAGVWVAMNISQERFNRIANAVTAAAFGIIAGCICLLADVGSWLSMIVAAAWTANASYEMNR